MHCRSHKSVATRFAKPFVLRRNCITLRQHNCANTRIYGSGSTWWERLSERKGSNVPVAKEFPVSSFCWPFPVALEKVRRCLSHCLSPEKYSPDYQHFTLLTDLNEHPSLARTHPCCATLFLCGIVLHSSKHFISVNQSSSMLIGSIIHICRQVSMQM